MNNRTRHHICLSIAGSLRQSNNSLNGILSEDGKAMTGKEVKEFLARVRDEHGYTHYSGCDNMDSKGMCAGHPISENAKTN